MAKTPSPMMLQWHTLKEQSPNSLLLFRLGDFYETFLEDAHLLSDLLEVILTKRHDIPMAGIPVQSLEPHLKTLVDAGITVAIAEQIPLAKGAKGPMQRKIARCVSKATYIPEKTELTPSNQFLCFILYISSKFELSFVDISTGLLLTATTQSIEDVIDLVVRYSPLEILIDPILSSLYGEHIEKIRKNVTHLVVEYTSQNVKLIETLQLFEATFPAENTLSKEAKVGAAALLYYLKQEMHVDVSTISTLQTLDNETYMKMNAHALLTLDILPSSKNNKTSLFSIINKTKTAAGSRMLLFFISTPLTSLEKIRQRQSHVTRLVDENDTVKQGVFLLKSVRDIERILVRLSRNGKRSHDLLLLKKSVTAIVSLMAIIPSNIHTHRKTSEQDILKLKDILENALSDTPEKSPFNIGFCHKLDQSISLRDDSEKVIRDYEKRLQEETGIKSLKISTSKALGLCIEVTKAASKHMPEQFEKKQTLVNAYRYITDTLEELEKSIIEAEENVNALISTLLEDITTVCLESSSSLIDIAQSCAYIDCILSFAQCALEFDLVEPALTEKNDIEISNGRHLLAESLLGPGEFIPNGTHLNEDSAIHIITGPNMAGKSTYLKQVALIVLLAQIGSYVPASQASIGIRDSIFTRIGAGDALSEGLSTFMVEMKETADIIKNYTSKSLVILDEVGRGTSTYDGLSIATSIITHLATVESSTPLTLFATHYHEITYLAETHLNIDNYRVAVDESNNNLTFLHAIEKGAANKSYGIHVAAIAGLPLSIIQNASRYLRNLEKPLHKNDSYLLEDVTTPSNELHYEKEIEAILSIDINTLTPLGALKILSEIQSSVKRL